MSSSEHRTTCDWLRAPGAGGNYLHVTATLLLLTALAAACGDVTLKATSLADGAVGEERFEEPFDVLDASLWTCEGRCPTLSAGRATFSLSAGALPGEEGAWSKVHLHARRFTSGTFSFRFALPAAPGAEVYWGMALWDEGSAADQSEYSEINLGTTRAEPFEPTRLDLVSARRGEQVVYSVDTGRDLYDGALHTGTIVYTRSEVAFYLDGELLETITDEGVIPDAPLALTLGTRLVRGPALPTGFDLILDRCDVEP
jgi:hypothetical protein